MMRIDWLPRFCRSLRSRVRVHNPRRRSQSHGLRVEALESRQLLSNAPVLDNLTPTPVNATISKQFTVGGDAYYDVSNSITGQHDLWKSDGSQTQPGTSVIKNLDGVISSQASVGSTFFFVAYNALSGHNELWTSNGTSTGTVILKSVGNGGPDNPNNLFNVNGTLYFTATDPSDNSLDLWKSSGTSAGTVSVKTLAASTGSLGDIEMGNVGNTLYFAYDSGSGSELWKSTGTSAGTGIVKSIANSGPQTPRQLRNVNNKLMFHAVDPNDNNGLDRLWVSDGTSNGTVVVRAAADGGPEAIAYDSQFQFAVVGTTLYFEASDPTFVDHRLWKSDGTSTGTIPVTVTGGAPVTSPDNFATLGSKLLFSADGPSGRMLWTTDGTAAGTMLVDSNASELNPTQLTTVGTKVYFKASDTYGTSGYELWKTDGTSSGTSLVSDIVPGQSTSDPKEFMNANGRLAFLATTGAEGMEPWTSDGTTAGTKRVTQFTLKDNPSSFQSIFTVGNLAYFGAYTDALGWSLWKSDGTLAGTVPVVSQLGNAPDNLQSYNGSVLFTVGGQFWKSNGTAAGTQLIVPVSGPIVDGPFTLVGNTLYFPAHNQIAPWLSTELWRSDGTESGTRLVRDVFPGTTSSSPSDLVNVNGTLYFVAADPADSERVLYKSDGTYSGTVPVRSAALVGPTTVSGLTTLGNLVYFTGSNATSGETGLYASNGTAAGTSLVASTSIGGASSVIAPIVNLNGKLYFTASDPTEGQTLFRYDPNTLIVEIVRAPSNGGPVNPTSLTLANGKLWMQAYHQGDNVYELFTSDGTSAGTVLVKSVANGGPNNPLTQFTAVNNFVYFSGTTTSEGTELWRSDGTSSGTQLVQDLNPFKDSNGNGVNSDPSRLTNLNGTLLFTADDGTHGTELFFLPKDAPSGTWTAVTTPTKTAVSSVSITFSSTVQNVTLDDFTLNGASLSTLSGSGTINLSNSGTVYTISGLSGYTATGTPNTTYTIAVAAGNNIQDASAHPLSGNPSVSWLMDTVAPTGTWVNSSPASVPLLDNLTTTPNSPSIHKQFTVGSFAYYSVSNTASGAYDLWKSDGATSTLVKSLSGPVTSEAALGSTFYFAAVNSLDGESELWSSDGTTAGTVVMKTVGSGGPRNPNNLINVNGTLYFTASNPGDDSLDLWKSNGTASGTTVVKVLAAGTSSLGDIELGNIGSTLYFAYDSGSGAELWKSNGTSAGTTLVRSVSAGGPLTPNNLRTVNGKLLFDAYVAGDGNYSRLWISDGTSGGTAVLKTPENGGPKGISYGDQGLPAVVGTTVYFGAYEDDGATFSLWKSDGTSAGTVLVTVSGGAHVFNPNGLVGLSSKVLFSADGPAGKSLWTSDGTPTGTKLVDPNSFQLNPSDLTVVGSNVFFKASETYGTSGFELWKTDGTASGTQLVSDIVPGLESSNPEGLMNANGRLAFRATTPIAGNALWTSDGTTAGTTLAGRLNFTDVASSFQSFTTLGNWAYFGAYTADEGYSLWKTDGTPQRTSAIATHLNTLPDLFYNFNGTLMFSLGGQLWKSDGTAAGTVLVVPVDGPIINGPFLNVGSVLYFPGYGGPGVNLGVELWRTDGTASGTRLVRDIFPGGASSPANLVNANGTLYFSATNPTDGQSALYKSDGTFSGTVLVASVAQGGVAGVSNLLAVGSTVYFIGQDNATGETDLYKSNGTTAGTVPVATSATGGPTQVTGPLVNLGGTVYFNGVHSVDGYELWKSNGTAAGTVPVKSVSSGGPSAPTNLTLANGKLWFQGTDPADGQTQAYVSDGTSAGTLPLKTPASGGPTQVSQFTAAANMVYFKGYSIDKGEELWRSDGTSSGTKLVSNINPKLDGSGNGISSSPTFLTTVNGTLLFAADDGTHGVELYAQPNGEFTGSTPIRSAVNSVFISFSTPVKNVTLDDFTFNGANLSTLAGVTIYDAGNGLYVIEGLYPYDGTIIPPTNYTVAIAGTNNIQDLAGNALSGLPSLPWVTGLTAAWTAVATPTKTAVNSATITFNAPVQTLSLADFTLNGTKLNTLSGVSVSNTGNVYTITGLSAFTATGSPNTTYTLAVAATNGILDTTGGTLFGTPSVAWVMDTIAPSSSWTAVTTPTKTPVSSVTVTFDSVVQNVSLDDFKLNGGSVAALTGSGTVSLSNSGNVYTISGLAGYTATGNPNTSYTVSVSATNNITDLAGNALANIPSVNWTMDTIVPTATWAAVTTPTKTAVNTVAITFSSAVQNVTLDDFTLNGARLNTLIGSGTVSLSNSGNVYTIGGLAGYSGKGSPNTVYTLAVAASTNITDPAGNALSGTPSVAWTLDTIAPTGTWTAVTSPTKTAVGSVSITFSSTVQNVTLDDFTLNGTSLSALTGSGTVSLSNSGNVYTISGLAGYAATGNPNTTYTVAVAATNNIADAASNALSGTPSVAWTLDTIAPTGTWTAVTSPTKTAVGTVSITFSSTVQNVTLDDFTLNGTSLSALTGSGTVSLSNSGNVYTINGLAGYAATGNPNTTYNVAVAATNNIADAASNALSGTPSVAWTLDTIAPTATWAAVTSPTKTAVNSVAITFNSTVQNVTLDDFTLNGTKLSTLSGSGTVTLSNSGNVFTIGGLAGYVAVGSPSTVYTVAVGTNNIADPAGNALAGTPSVVWTMDTVAPTGAWTAVTSPTKTAVGSVAITFNSTVQNVTLDDFTLNGTKLSTLSGSGTVALSSSGNVYTISGLAGYTATGSPNTVYTVAVAATNNIQDSSANLLSGTPSVAWTMDTIAPTGTWAAVATPTDTAVNSVAITFSSAVQTVALSDFTLNGTNVSTLSGVTLSHTGNVYTLSGLSASNATSANTLAVAAGNGIKDAAGNALSGTPSVSWALDATPPSATWGAVASPTRTAVNSVVITFSDPVQTVALSDFALNGTDLSTLPGVTLSQSGKVYTIAGLATYTGTGNPATTYAVTLDPNHGIQDLAGNSLSGLPSVSWLMDTLAPTGTWTPVATPTKTAVNSASITFAEAIQSATLSDLTLNGTKLNTLSGVTLSRSGNVYTVSGLAAFTGTGSPNTAYTLAVAATNGLKDTAGNPLSGTPSVVWVMDTIAPTATWTAVTTPTKTAVSSVKVTFSESVQNVSLDDFTLNGTKLNTLTGSGTVTLSNTGSVYTIGGLAGYVGVGSPNTAYTIALVAASNIRDAATNSLTGTPSVAWTMDTTAPTGTWTAVASPRNSAVASVVVTFSEAVQTVALSDFTLNSTRLSTLSGVTLAHTGNVYTIGGLTAFTGSGASTTSFTVAVSSVNGIKDPAGNALTGTPTVAWTLDVAPPTATWTQVASPTRTAVNSVQITFSSAVQNVTLSNFTLDGVKLSTLSGTSIALVSGNTYAISGLSAYDTANDIYTLAVASGNTIRDGAGNSLAALAGMSWEMDTIAPAGAWTAVAPRTLTAVNSVKITFNEDLQNVALSDFTLNGTKLSTLSGTSITAFSDNSYIISGLSAYDTVGSPNTTYTVAVASPHGIKDLAGNPYTGTASLSWVMDKVAPTGAWTAAASPTKTSVASMKITFPETMQNVTTANFALNGVKLNTLSGVTIAAAGNVYTISGLAAFNATGNPPQTYTLAVVSGHTIKDQAGNALSGLPATSWVLDKLPPTGAWTAVATPTKTAVASVKITFSEAMLNVTTANFTLNGAKLNTLSGVTIAAAGNVYTISGLAAHDAVGTPAKTYTLAVASGNTITDQVGNPLSGLPATSWVMDTAAPTSAWTAVVTPTRIAVSSVQVTFSEAVQNVSTANFTLNGVKLSTLSGVTIAAAGNVYTISGLAAHDAVGSPNKAYTVAVVSGNTIKDLAGNALSGTPSVSWEMDRVSPTATWTAVTTPRTTALDSVKVTFSEKVQNVTLSNFTLNGTKLNTLTGPSIAAFSGNAYIISGLSAFDKVAKTYTVAIVSGNTITDLAGNALTGTPSVSWVMSVTAPPPVAVPSSASLALAGTPLPPVAKQAVADSIAASASAVTPTTAPPTAAASSVPSTSSKAAISPATPPVSSALSAAETDAYWANLSGSLQANSPDVLAWSH